MTWEILCRKLQAKTTRAGQSPRVLGQRVERHLQTSAVECWHGFAAVNPRLKRTCGPTAERWWSPPTSTCFRLKKHVFSSISNIWCFTWDVHMDVFGEQKTPRTPTNELQVGNDHRHGTKQRLDPVPSCELWEAEHLSTYISYIIHRTNLISHLSSSVSKSGLRAFKFSGNSVLPA